MKTFILRTKFKSNLCRLSIFCNMREKFISPPFQWMGGYTLLLLDNPIPNVFYKKKWIALQSVSDGTSPFFWTWKSLIGIRFHRAEDWCQCRFNSNWLWCLPRGDEAIVCLMERYNFPHTAPTITCDWFVCSR